MKADQVASCRSFLRGYCSGALLARNPLHWVQFGLYVEAAHSRDGYAAHGTSAFLTPTVATRRYRPFLNKLLVGQNFLAESVHLHDIR